jgi:hypothetical protein
MWAPQGAEVDASQPGSGDAVSAAIEVPTGPMWQKIARDSAANFIAKLDGQGIAVASGALNDTFSRNLWSQAVFVEAFIVKGGIPLVCRLASTASDDSLFYR